MKNWKIVVSIGSMTVFCLFGRIQAEVAEREIALAKESEAYCEQTAKAKPTVKIIVEKVKTAVELLNEEGSAALPKFKGNGSEFIFNGTYLWIHAYDGEMIMHPIKTAMVGRNVLKNTDLNGKLFFREMTTEVKAKGEGWIEYVWPKPGQTVSSKKVSYVHGAELEGRKVVVGCGVYDLTMDQVNAEYKKVSSTAKE